MTSTSKNSGTPDGWTSTRGPAYLSMVVKARTATWASIADDEDWHAKALARMNHESLHATPNSWRSLDKTRQKEFLDGTRKPNRKTLDGVGITAPLSQHVHQNALWIALRPDTDVPTCRAILASLISSYSADSLVDYLSRGASPASRENVIELDVVTALVAAIRVAMSEKAHPKAFDYGRALVYILWIDLCRPSLQRILRCRVAGDRRRRT
ncbi:hypothetical protein [Rhodanobacter sp. 115]|uniref:hypothetical protein n=1 Tax=Rhodanobacter sp. FW021-MT20 TaxID=1162282 RepID=UPI0012FAD47E|nr:hypothetical protein [Rhodanobacter sp. 115]